MKTNVLRAAYVAAMGRLLPPKRKVCPACGCPEDLLVKHNPNCRYSDFRGNVIVVPLTAEGDGVCK